jgi:hypothetical protein
MATCVVDRYKQVLLTVVIFQESCFVQYLHVFYLYIFVFHENNKSKLFEKKKNWLFLLITVERRCRRYVVFIAFHHV